MIIGGVFLGSLAVALLVGPVLHGPMQRAYPAVRGQQWRIWGGSRRYDSPRIRV